MRWKLFATLAEAAGERTVDVRVEGNPTVRKAFEALLASHPALEPRVLDDEGALRDHIHLLCDGQNPFRNDEGWESQVEAEAELALLPPMSGG